jgi:hypothetical protein
LGKTYFFLKIEEENKVLCNETETLEEFGEQDYPELPRAGLKEAPGRVGLRYGFELKDTVGLVR